MSGVIQSTKELAQRTLYYLRHYDRHYSRFQALLRMLESLTPAETRAWQFRRMTQLVTLAYERTDFYRELYDQAGIHPRDLREPADVAHLPVIHKDMVRGNAERMVVSGIPRSALHKVMTSGTSGSPLTVYSHDAAAAAERASIRHQWERVGYRPEGGRVEFRGALSDSEAFRHIRADRVLRININKLDPQHVHELVKEINSCPYLYFHGYPSALTRFATLLMQEGLTRSLRSPRAILMASEMVLEAQLDRLESVFPKSQLFAHYGQAERVALGAWTATSRTYHFLPGYAWVELDERGCLIGSSLVNEVMPLLRYRTTDVLSGFQAEPSTMPQLFPMAERIEGRLEDQLRTPTGGFISPARITFPFKEGRSFTACKLIQHAPDHLELVAESRLPEEVVREEFATIIAQLAPIFGPAMRFQLTQVHEIPRMPSGKFKWVESRL
jgi:phenylacetate-CoA ligase